MLIGISLRFLTAKPYRHWVMNIVIRIENSKYVWEERRHESEDFIDL